MRVAKLKDRETNTGEIRRLFTDSVSCVNNADTEKVPLQRGSLETRTLALSNYFDCSPAASHNKCPQTHQGCNHIAGCVSLQIYGHTEIR